MRTATYSAEQFADLLGVSPWSIYQSVKSGTCPIDPIRVGQRRLVWSKAAVDRLLGLDTHENDPDTGPSPVDIALT
jgi:predicted DNA-binding transcriptional regulator AlpA